VSLLLSATAVPESEATFLNIFCDEPLSVFVYVTTKLFVAKPVTVSLKPVPAENERSLLEPKSVLSILGVPTVASERINEPSASHWSVA